jgi:hypothetical protein
MITLDTMNVVDLEELAAKLRHAIARNHEHSQMEVELEDVKQWIAYRQNRDSSGSAA